MTFDLNSVPCRALATLKSLLGVFADVDEPSHTMGFPALKSGSKFLVQGGGNKWPQRSKWVNLKAYVAILLRLDVIEHHRRWGG
jgi:hypothetical protein